MIAEFSNGDPPLALLSLGDGRWDGTWQTVASTDGITVTVRAISPGTQLTGSSTVSGSFNASQQPPVVPLNGVTNSITNTPFQSLAPGGLITITGAMLSDETANAPSVPLPNSLGDTTVLMGRQQMPLSSTAPNQVVAIVPFGVAVNTQQQVLLQRGSTYSVPVPVNLAAASPAIFTNPNPTDGSQMQGMITDANGNAVAPGNAARAGDVVTLWCAGLGELNPTVATGAAGPSGNANTQATVSIGGLNAAVSSSGLAPQMVGIYFVQATVPDGVPAGNQVPVTVTSSTAQPVTSPPVNMAITM